MPAQAEFPKVIALTPAHRLTPELAIAASRAHAFGVLDLGIGLAPAPVAAALAAIAAAGASGNWGARWDTLGQPSRALDRLARLLDEAQAPQLPVLVLAGLDAAQLAGALAPARQLGRLIFAEVLDLASARAAQAAGCDGLIAKGHEAGGAVSRLSSFRVMQEFAGKLDLPYFIQGGIGPHSAAAASLAGAAGVVLCEQLWLAAEGPYGHGDLGAPWRRLDGSETTLIGDGERHYRFFKRSGRTAQRTLERAAAAAQDWPALLPDLLAGTDDPLLAAGQDIAFAAPLAARYGSAGRIVGAMRDSIAAGAALAPNLAALGRDATLASSHGTRYPLVQGPMTRVSDVAAFADAVAEAGALPFLALAVMRGPDARRMLDETKARLGARPWGVGVLGFMPLALRQEQLEAIRAVKPPFALIAGGRPSQARELEQLGITTYLHVPSPGLLSGFLAEGARHFVFEGSECGGHTGPRTSFILWEAAIAVLLESAIPDPQTLHILFAGGIHDALSAAMVALLAAPLVARGVKVGLLMGTAYLFTEEIVQAGAIVAEFQRQALACEETALLQSGVGSYTRCATTPFCAEFDAARRALVLAAASEEETLTTLEMMNIGRLRIAAKGITRASGAQAGSRFIDVDQEQQRREGMYMLGDVARLRHATCTLAQLHQTVCGASLDLLRSHQQQHAQAPRRNLVNHDDIAIVGMACLFPGAQNLRQYWQNIVRGVDSIGPVPDGRWDAAGLFDAKRGVPDKIYATSGGFLDDIDFDPQRYGIAPASLASIEPMQMLALEVARQALADAGFEQRPFPRERTATIFAVGGMSDLSTQYNFRTLLPLYLAKVEGLPDTMRKHILDSLNQHALPAWTEDSFPGILGNVISGRIANRLDLGGSNFTVDAACAASLSALDAGIKQLRCGEADVVLAGGADCSNGPIGFMSFSQTYALSPRGRSRPFERSADGIAISEGVAAVVLKRLGDAERDGDRIYALIKGIGSSSDGRNRSLTAPHPAGQVAALQRAYLDAGVEPAQVSLLEAHGTGTALGDKSEIAALQTAFGGGALAPRSCAIGSVKSMIGHTKVAAGMAGLIKAALALQQRVLPPTIGVERPGAALESPRSPFYINTETRPWLQADSPHARHCGVSAFGFGGTNYHAVLGEYTARYRASDQSSLHPREAEVFAFAGATRADITAALKQLLRGLEHGQHLVLEQLAYAVYRDQHAGRRANGGQPCRLTLLAASIGDLRQKLGLALELLPVNAQIRHPSGLYYRESASDAGPVCFLFPGQGTQKVNMLRELVSGQAALQRFFSAPPDGEDRADASELAAIAGLIYPPPVFSDTERSAQQQALNATEVAQPALGMVGMAAFELLNGYGLSPDFAAGHSYGEYLALYAAGAITRADLSRLSLLRGRLAAAAPAGAMAALEANEEETAAAIARHGLAVAIANLNAPAQTIVGGAAAAVDSALAAFAADGLRVRKLAVGAAFHGPAMEAASLALAQQLAGTDIKTPRFPVYSNSTAQPYPADSEAMRALLARHIAEPVRFVDQIENLHQAGARVFMECGPGHVLSGLVDSILAGRPHTTLTLDAPGRPGWLALAHLLAQALSIGLPLDLAPWFAGRGLADCTLEQLLSEAAKRAKPGPLIWRVNGGRAVPWHAPARPAALLKPAPSIPAPPALAPPAPPLRPTPPIHHDRSIPMKKEAERPAPGALAPSQFTQIQHGLARLLDLQCEQQASLRHFLDFQAQLVGLGGGVVGNGHPAALAEAAPQDMPQHMQQYMQQDMRQNMPERQATIAPAAPEIRLRTQLERAVTAPLPPAQVPLPPQLPRQLAGAGIGLAIDTLAGPVRELAPSSAAVAAPPLAALTATGGAPASAAQFKAELLQAVSERTGYPVDMLDLDAQMEADLGIDSIKRIEIFSGLGNRYDLIGARDEESVISELSGYKTLNDIVGWYERMAAEVPAAGGTLPKKASTPLSLPDGEVESGSIAAIAPITQDETADADAADPVLRYVLRARRAGAVAPLARKEETGAARHPVWLAGAATPLSAALSAALRLRGYQVCQLVPGTATQVLERQVYQVDFSSLETVRELAPLLDAPDRRPGMLINLLGMEDDGAPAAPRLDHGRSLFLLLKLCEPDLKAGIQDGAGWLLNLTAFDGRFGLGRGRAFAVGGAGTLGVAKSAAREWPGLRVKCIDAAPGLAPDWLAERVLEEMDDADEQVEVGYDDEGRWRLELVQDGLAAEALPGPALEAGAVLLVTGGAYGITADICRALAARDRPRLVIAGRSPLPADEAPALRNIGAGAELKQYLIRQMRDQGQAPTPVQVERALRRIVKDREMRANLAAMRASGAEVEYHCLDVRDSAAFGQLIDAVYARLGRIDGVLHGAGVIGDKLIADKTLASFDAVFDTKVLPALVLVNKLRPDSLKFLAFFSSVAGRFGNIGQSDYSAANEVLNKLADRLGHAWPQVRTVAINWGPWDAGMVDAGLRKLYAARAIVPIPGATGLRHFLREIERGAGAETELVISSSLAQIAALRLVQPSSPSPTIKEFQQ